MKPLPASPLFSGAEAREHGWSDAAFSPAVRRGSVIRLRRGCYTTQPPDALLRALAAAGSCSGAVLSHRSALLAHGLPVIGAPTVPQLTVAPRATGDLVAAERHRAALGPEDLALVGDIMATSVARTLIDVARRHGVLQAVAALDAALHSHRVTEEELQSVLRRCWNWPRIRRAFERGLARDRSGLPRLWSIQPP